MIARRARWIAAFAVASTSGALGVACTNDFDQFTPSSDASAPQGDGASGSETGLHDTGSPVDTAAPDAGTGVDAADANVAPDAGCTPPASCFSTAKACGSACGQVSLACQQAGGCNAACKVACKQKELQCRAKCQTTCGTCAQSAGCADPLDCADAASSD